MYNLDRYFNLQHELYNYIILVYKIFKFFVNSTKNLILKVLTVHFGLKHNFKIGLNL